MAKADVQAAILKYVKDNNTLALAVCLDNVPHVTPLEYFFYEKDKCFYIFSEGGAKFQYLEQNKNVAFTIYNGYSGFNAVQSLQVEGTADVLDYWSDEYVDVFTAKGLNAEKLKSKGIEMNLVKIVPTSYTYLNSSYRKDGLNTIQKVDSLD